MWFRAEMSSNKRIGNGGNSSRDPRGNLAAQSNFKSQNNKKTKKCTGFLHHDGDEINVDNFRQQKANNSSGLQSRCDICNRLYFSIIQKPIKRIAAIAIWADISGDFDWRLSVPEILKEGIEKCVNSWLSNKCENNNCNYLFKHSSYRSSAAVLTDFWKNRDKEEKDSYIIDKKTKTKYPAPKFMEDLQNWGSTGGVLDLLIDNTIVWDWWVDLFDKDTAYDSSEIKQAKKLSSIAPPQHALSDFTWGSGNILDTVQGHSVPGFNQVRSSSRIIPKPSSSSNRVYGYLAEGDRLKMMEFSVECKKKGLSLGHSPAPLRWLGKDDPINAKGQLLRENILLSDSLIDLYNLSKVSVEKAKDCVSWQIVNIVGELTTREVSFEVFTQEIQSFVEEYFDNLYNSQKVDGNIIISHLKIADPGKTDEVYKYREAKVIQWLESRPNFQIRR